MNNELLDDILSESDILLQGLAANEAHEGTEALDTKYMPAMNFTIRSSFNQIIGMTELLRTGKVGPISLKQKELFTNMLSGSSNILELVPQES